MGKLLFILLKIDQLSSEYSTDFSFGCIGIVLIFDVFLWFANVEIFPVYFIRNDLTSLDIFALDFIADILLAISALSLQLSFRLYLRFVKQIIESNEILSIKIILLLLSCYLSYLLPLPATSQDYLPPYALILAMVPTMVIYDHNGFRKFFMENHPILQKKVLIANECYMKYSNIIQSSIFDDIV